VVDHKPECFGISSRSWGRGDGAGVRVGFWILIAQAEPRNLYFHDPLASPEQLCQVGAAANAAIVNLSSGVSMPAVHIGLATFDGFETDS